MMNRCIVFFLALALSGCAALKPKESNALDTGSLESASLPELRVLFAPHCPVSNATAESIVGTIGLAITSSVAGKLAEGSVEALGNYLTADKAVPLIETGRMEGFAASQNGALTYNPSEGCMILMAGKDFGRDLSPKEVEAILPFANQGTPDPAINLALHNLSGLSGPLVFYMELTFHFNRLENPSAFTLVPRSWYYPAFFTPSGFRFSAKRDVLLRLEFSTPGAKGNFGEFELNWNAIGEGMLRENIVLKKKLPWAPLPDDLENAAQQIKSTSKIPVGPTNVKVLLTETAKPHTILKYVGEALKANKDTIATTAKDSVNQAFSQEARVAARSAATNKVDERYKAYASAYDEAEAAQQKYAAATGAVKQKALGTARLAYAKLANSQASVAAIYGSAGIGTFTPLPPLPPLE